MTLRQCNFEFAQYSERGIPICSTTEIINKPLNYEFRGFVHFNQNVYRAIMHHLKNRPYMESSQRSGFSLAVEINLDFVMWGMLHNGLTKDRLIGLRVLVVALTQTKVKIELNVLLHIWSPFVLTRHSVTNLFMVINLNPRFLMKPTNILKYLLRM